jgi:hypothetical protein
LAARHRHVFAADAHARRLAVPKAWERGAA